MNIFSLDPGFLLSHVCIARTDKILFYIVHPTLIINELAKACQMDFSNMLKSKTSLSEN